MFQGILRDSSDILVTDTKDIILSLYNVSTGGTTLWTETHDNIGVDDGIFTVYAGSITSLSTLNFAEELYLEISVANSDGTNSETLSPRIKIASSPFTLSASNVQGTATSELTGDITLDADDTVAGTSTIFQSELTVGDRITVDGQTRTVTGITSDAILTVDTAFTGTNTDTTPDKLAAEFIVRDSSGNVDFLIQDTGAILFGGTIETIANAGFVLNGPDVFIADSLGVEGNIYIDGSLFIGSTEFTGGAITVGDTTYDDGTITEASGSLTVSLNDAAGDDFIVDSSTDFIIESDTGQVGIGIADPTSELHVDGTITVTDVVLEGRLKQDKGTDEASASELTLATDGNTFDITGTTTINTISPTNWQVGNIIHLQFDGALTVTHNSGGTNDILLGNQSNMTTAAGDVLSLFFDGTDWVEMGRSIVDGPTVFTSTSILTATTNNNNADFESLVTVTPTFTGSKTLIVNLTVGFTTASSTGYKVQMPALNSGANCGAGADTLQDIVLWNQGGTDTNTHVLTQQWICTGVSSGQAIAITSSSFTNTVNHNNVLLSVLVV